MIGNHPKQEIIQISLGNEWTNSENSDSEILPSSIKEWIIGTCNHSDESQIYYATYRNQPQTSTY